MATQAILQPQAISQHLTDIWTKILKKEVKPNDNFFDLGGSSLNGIQMIMEVQSAYDVELDLETFFEEPCIANLTNTIVEILTMVRCNEQK
jgi:acyl carrier protein